MSRQSGSGACDLVGDGDLDVLAADVSAAADLFAAAGVCVFRDLLPLDVVNGCRAAFEHRSTQIDAGLASRAVDLGTQFRFNEVIRRRAARYDIRCGGKECDERERGFDHPSLWKDA
jgi:hypothetical protein